MKKFAIIIASFLLVTFTYAVEKGPKAKNQKAWNKAKSTTVIVSNTEQEKLVGPKAKNIAVQDQSRDTEKEVVILNTKKRVTGPKAKNAKPWKN